MSRNILLSSGTDGVVLKEAIFELFGATLSGRMLVWFVRECNSAKGETLAVKDAGDWLGERCS